MSHRLIEAPEMDDGEWDMPVPCSDCGKTIELNSANFFVREFCDCNRSNGCTHGICDECCRRMERGMK